MTYSFLSKERFKVAGRGTVHTVNLKEPTPLKVGDKIRINMTDCEISGLETLARHYTHEGYFGYVGFLIKGNPEIPEVK